MLLGLDIQDALRLGLFLFLAIPFSVLSGWSVRWWHRDYGLPWRRLPGSNGKSLVDALVTAVLCLISAVLWIGIGAMLIEGDRWGRLTSTVLMWLLGSLAWVLVAAIWRERRRRRDHEG